MQKWEYAVRADLGDGRYGDGRPTRTNRQALNEMGDLGWEAVGIWASRPNVAYVLYKRPKQAKAANED